MEPAAAARDHIELEQRISAILDKHEVPGMGAVIVNRGGIVWTVGIGQADVAAGTPVSPDTLLRIGSISKTFVGLAALKLVEEGRLNMESPVRSLVPEVEFTNQWEHRSCTSGPPSRAHYGVGQPAVQGVRP